MISLPGVQAIEGAQRLRSAGEAVSMARRARRKGRAQQVMAVEYGSRGQRNERDKPWTDGPALPQGLDENVAHGGHPWRTLH
jgi:hypothetical protein